MLHHVVDYLCDTDRALTYYVRARFFELFRMLSIFRTESIYLDLELKKLDQIYSWGQLLQPLTMNTKSSEPVEPDLVRYY